MEHLIKDLDRDEVRSGFLVTSRRKKIWNVELMILMELDRICKKHGLRYFLDSGTMLGAVRHQGFIPWDDDMDLVMMRPEYEELKRIAPVEMKDPFFFQTVYTDRCIYNIAKCRYNRSSAIEFPRDREVNQGVFIDIWPLDAVADGSPRSERIYLIERELYTATVDSESAWHMLEQGENVIPSETLRRVLALPAVERFREFESFCEKHFHDSSMVNCFAMEAGGRFQYEDCSKKLYEDVVYLPFEGLELPVPVGYEELLRRYYGDWRKIVKMSAHATFLFSPDIPYGELLDKISFDDGDCGIANF